MKFLTTVTLILGLLVLLVSTSFSQATYTEGLFADKVGLEFKIGAKGGGQLQAMPGKWSDMRFTPGVGLTVENNLFHFKNGMFDLGFMLDVYYTQKGAVWNQDGPSGELITGKINADYITIPFFVKFRYAKGFDVGAGWIIPGIIAGFESNIFLTTEYYHDASDYTYFFYDRKKIGDGPLEDAVVKGFKGFTPGFQIGMSWAFLFDFGEINLEIKYAMDLIPALSPEQDLVVPLGLDSRQSYDDTYILDIPDVQSQGIIFYLSYSVPLYIFQKGYKDTPDMRVYTGNPETKGYKKRNGGGSGVPLDLDEEETSTTVETEDFATSELDLNATTDEESTGPNDSTQELAEQGIEETSEMIDETEEAANVEAEANVDANVEAEANVDTDAEVEVEVEADAEGETSADTEGE